MIEVSGSNWKAYMNIIKRILQNKALQASDYRDRHDLIDNLVARGRIEEIKRLADDLIDKMQVGFHRDSQPYFDLFSHLLEVLVWTPGKVNVEVLLDIGIFESIPPRYLRETAAQLVQVRPLEVLDSVIGSRSDDERAELMALLVHEAVIHGADLQQYPNLKRVGVNLAATDHPLGKLPLELLPHEQTLGGFRRFYNSASVSSAGISYDRPLEERQALQRAASTHVFIEVTAEGNRDQMVTAFSNWLEESGGRVEARVFSSNEVLNADTLIETGLLTEMGLACLTDTVPNDIHIMMVPPSSVVEVLFSAAGTGGAYNYGHYHAYGRLEAWESIRGLLGKGPGVGIRQLHDAMDSAIWFQFDGAFGWFYLVAWDVGIAVIREDRHTLAILAATDTD
jgi:hypothetical protein